MGGGELNQWGGGGELTEKILGIFSVNFSVKREFKNPALGSFQLTPAPLTDWPPPPHPHWYNPLRTDLTLYSVVDMRNNKRSNDSTRAPVNSSQSEMSSLPRGGEGVKFLVTSRGGGGGGVTKKDPSFVSTYYNGDLHTKYILSKSTSLSYKERIYFWKEYTLCANPHYLNKVA